MLPLKEKELLRRLKSKRKPREDKRSLSFNSTTNKPVLIKRPMKSWSTSLCSRKPKDNTRWERLNGKERSRLESTFWRMCIKPERKTFFSNRPRKEKWSGSKSTKDNKLKLLLLNRMRSSKLEQPRRPLQERIIRWIFWSKWTKRIEFKEPICKRKCTRKEQQNWQS